MRSRQPLLRADIVGSPAETSALRRPMNDEAGRRRLGLDGRVSAGDQVPGTSSSRAA
ncbi:MAG: hypothetical protein U0575_13860 [Phycisphaerales bacterium]